MIFKTELLTYRPTHKQFNAFPANKNCADLECMEKEWVVPKKPGSRISIVFSTECVRGAVRCEVRDLHLAGRIALQTVAAPIMEEYPATQMRIGGIMIPISGRTLGWRFWKGGRVMSKDPLWWWVEVVHA